MENDDRDDVKKFFSPVGWIGVALIALTCFAVFIILTLELFLRLETYEIYRNLLFVGSVGGMMSSVDLIIRELAGLRKKNKSKRK